MTKCRRCGLVFDRAGDRNKNCKGCQAETTSGACTECGAEVVRTEGNTGPLPKRCKPCAKRRKYEQSQASKDRSWATNPEFRRKERERRRKQVARWRAANPERRRANDRASKARAYADPERRERIKRNYKLAKMRRDFGLTATEAEAIYELRAAGCAICGRVENGKGLALDHCHATNKPRGWLCSTCNSGLGQFYDRPDLLRTAADYLES